MTGSEVGITVDPAAATHFVLTAPASVRAGVAFTVTLTAVDAYGNVATGYTGRVHFTSTDRKARLPGAHTFTAADAGVYSFTVILKSTGSRTITATDTGSGSITGSAVVDVTH